MSAISSLSSFLQNLSLVQTSQNNIAKLTYQVDTGLKSQDLQGYGTEANQLLNLQSGQTTEQNYVSNNTQTQTITSAYDSTLGQLSTDATTLNASLDAFSATDTISAANLKTLVNSLSVDIAATLNTQVGDRYLYGGTRYATAPVGDLTAYLNNAANVPTIVAAVPPSTTPTVQPLTVASTTIPSPQTVPPTLPVPGYDSQAATLNASPAPSAAVLAAAGQTYATQTTAIANNQTATYGVSSNDPTFQHLVYALQNALAAANISPTTPALQANQQAYLDQAKSEIETVLNGVTAVAAVAASAGPPAVAAVAAVAGVSGIPGLQDTNGLAEETIANANTVHNQTLATLQSQITTITQVDPATVAAELSAAQTQLEGSYKVVSSVLSDTLLNYLK